MKRILLFGGTGRTGELIIDYALKNGYAVNALARNPEKISTKSEHLNVIKGTPTNIEDVRNAMKDCNVVISVLSALPEKDSISFRKIEPPHILETSIGNALKVMKELGKRRIITLSSIGVGDSYPYAPWYMKLFIKISNFKIVFADHDKEENLLRNSSLDWTIARPVALNNKTEIGQLVVSYGKTPKPFKMSRMQLAKFLVDSIDDKNMIGKEPILSEK